MSSDLKKNSIKYFPLVPLVLIVFSSCDYFFPPFSGERITVEEAYKYISRNENSEDLVIIDVRNAVLYSENHISGAVNYDYDSTGFPSLIENLDRSKVYIVYSDDDRKSFNTLELMLELNFEHAHAIKGGLLQWKNMGYPLKKVQ
jgi:rhodanese-related sulfurtransferase